MDKRDRPRQGGKGGAHPSAIRDAAEQVILRELPFPLPVNRYDRALWASRGITLALLRGVVDSMAAAGKVRVEPTPSGLRVTAATAPNATTTATTAAAGDAPGPHREGTPS